MIGAGFTASDCCRTARRIGAEEVFVCYRRSQEEAALDANELNETTNEGVNFVYLVSPLEVLGDSEGRVTGVRFIRNRLGEPDSDGRRIPRPIPGSEFTIDCDVVLAATGQKADFSWIPKNMKLAFNRDGSLRVNPQTWMTSVKGLFAGGDFTQGARNAISSIADGHKAAITIHQFLSGEKLPEQISYHEIVEVWDRDLAYKALEPQIIPTLEIEKRIGLDINLNLETEVELGFTRDMAIKEATRCLQCLFNIHIDSGLCTLCGACVDVCEDKVLSIVSLRKIAEEEGDYDLLEDSDIAGALTLTMDESKCVRCGQCVARCPTQAIQISCFSFKGPKEHWYVGVKG